MVLAQEREAAAVLTGTKISQAASGSAPMRVHHLDTDITEGKCWLWFAADAGFATKFLKAFTEVISRNADSRSRWCRESAIDRSGWPWQKPQGIRAARVLMMR